MKSAAVYITCGFILNQLFPTFGGYFVCLSSCFIRGGFHNYNGMAAVVLPISACGQPKDTGEKAPAGVAGGNVVGAVMDTSLQF